MQAANKLSVTLFQATLRKRLAIRSPQLKSSILSFSKGASLTRRRRTSRKTKLLARKSASDHLRGIDHTSRLESEITRVLCIVSLREVQQDLRLQH